MFCEYCHHEMTTATSCITVPFDDGTVPQPYGVEQPGTLRWPAVSNPYLPEPNERCMDCGVMPGGFHHPGCDCETCPICGGRVMGACQHGCKA